MKKLFSLIAAIALVITMIPFQSTFAATNDSKVRVSDKVWVGNMEAQHGALITFTEEGNNTWKDTEDLTLRLPDGISWSKYTRINARLIDMANVDGRDLKIKLVNSDIVDRIVVDPYFDIDRSVAKGDLMLKVYKGNVADTDKDLVIAEIKDYGAKLSSIAVEDFNFIKPGSKEVTVYLEEFVDGSLVDSQIYDLLLKNADIDKSKGVVVKSLTGDKKLMVTLNDDYIKLNVDRTPGKGKWAITFTMIPNKEYEGDIVLDFEGRDVEDSITLGRVFKDVDMMTGTATSIGLGFRDQAVADIQITESERAGLVKGVYTIAINPEYKGLSFTDAKIEVIDGNIDIDNFEYRDGKLQFEVKSSSTRESKIVISNIKVTVDQFGYLGDYKGELMFNYKEADQVKIGEAVLFNATGSKPSEGDAKYVGQFIIGNPNFIITTNGINRVETFDAAPYIQNERTMMSVKAAGVALDAQVSYNADKKMVTVESGDTMATMTIGSKILTINGQEKEMDTAAEIRSDRTFIPLAFLAEVFGAELEWDGITKTVTLMKN